MRDKTTKILFYPAKRNKKILFILSNDFITGMNTNAAEMTSVMMTGPSIRSAVVRTM